MSAYSEKLKGIGFLSKKGTSIKNPVKDEFDGTVAGYHVEHWNGSRDATVFAKTVELKVKVEKPDGS
jgi:hypothetical protein